MKIGYNEATARDCSSLEKDLQLCEECGFDYIEIRLDMLRAYLAMHTVEELKSFFAQSHLKPHAINALYIYPELFTEDDEPQKQKSVMEEFNLGCMVGREIGASYFIVVTPLQDGPFTSPYAGSWDDTLYHCTRILRKLADIAAGYDMSLCFELVGAPRSSVRSIEQATKIIQAVERENVGLVLDAYNLYMNERLNDFKVIRTVESQKIFAVHINNADETTNNEMGQDKRRFCDRGVINLDNFLANLQAVGYSDMVSIETFRPEYWKKEAGWVIREAYRTTYEVLKKNNCI